MANILPTALFANYDLLANNDTVTTDGIFIPLASLPALSAAEANPATGNGMEIVRAIINKAYEAIANLPNDDKPTKSNITRQSLNFLPNGNYERNYSLKFELEFSDNAAQSVSE